MVILLDRIEYKLYLESYLGFGRDLMFLPSLPTLRGWPDVLASCCQLPAQSALFSWQPQARQMG